MNKILVTEPSVLNSLKVSSALTFVGQDNSDDNLQAILRWVKSYTALKREDVYIIKGKLMNETAVLTFANAYPPDLNIVAIKLNDIEDFDKIVLPRFAVCGRWVDNNRQP